MYPYFHYIYWKTSGTRHQNHVSPSFNGFIYLRMCQHGRSISFCQDWHQGPGSKQLHKDSVRKSKYYEYHTLFPSRDYIKMLDEHLFCQSCLVFPPISLLIRTLTPTYRNEQRSLFWVAQLNKENKTLFFKKKNPLLIIL